VCERSASVITHKRSRALVVKLLKAFLQAALVFLAVVFGEFSPIAGHVAREEVHRVLSAFFESGKRSRRGDQWSEVKQRFSFDLLHEKSPPLEFWVLLRRHRRAVHEKANALRGGGRRLSVGAVKGAGVWAFTGAKRKPLTEEAGGSGAGFSQEGQCERCLAIRKGPVVRRCPRDRESGSARRPRGETVVVG
jgi:hypothetical protein